MYNPFLVGSLKKCETGEAVDAAFTKHRIADLNKRIKYLGYCQGNPEFFYAGGAKNNDGGDLFSKYLTVRSVFVTGSWR
jgi:hypothetical protein